MKSNLHRTCRLALVVIGLAAMGMLATATRSSNAVGVLVSELDGPFFGAMLSAFEKTFKAAGKFVLVAAGHNDEAQERDAIRFLVNRNCDALIVHSEALPDRFFAEHDHDKMPLIIMNRKVRGLADRCFSLNNELGGYLAAQSLLKLKHRRIAYISGPLDWVDAKQRLAGHKRALSEAGVKFDERLLHEGDYHETGGQDALNALLAKDIAFTAVRADDIACSHDARTFDLAPGDPVAKGEDRVVLLTEVGDGGETGCQNLRAFEAPWIARSAAFCTTRRSLSFGPFS
jgi:LacI family transcriptional regulator